MLSLISISLVVVSAGDGDDEAENVEAVNDNYDDEENEEDTVATETPTDAPSEDKLSEDVEVEKTEAVVEEVVEPSEDSVDVEPVKVGKQKGKYMAYDDYQWQSAVDASDSGYDWNSELIFYYG